MKKLLKAIFCGLLVTTMVTASIGCGGSGGNNTGEGSDWKKIDFGASFDYYPDIEKVNKDLSGTIDVVLVFDGTQKGWEALANEYANIHGGQVKVKLNTQYDSAGYRNAVTGQETNYDTSDWDIVQGNLLSSVSSTCKNMNSELKKANPYANNKTWKSVLDESAYTTNGVSGATYIMNSESLMTAWFVRKTALNDAKSAGYTGHDNPTTWDEMIELCSCMKKAGYTNPLGVSVSKDSIDNDQFSWILRIYGDYYYRQFYKDISSTSYSYDPTDISPETDTNFKEEDSRLYNIILDDSKENAARDQAGASYVGAKSEIFGDFLNNIYKMKPYIQANAGDDNEGLTTQEGYFATQNKGKGSPQIILDYLGRGLYFSSMKNTMGDFDYFTYPVMESSFVDSTTVVRGVGGNGGYLSIFEKKDANQSALNLDFMKFVMSPYGQSVYYKGLSENNATPKALTLVKNVVVPQAWSDFFGSSNTKIKSIQEVGQVDINPFVSHLIRFFKSDIISSKTASKTLWKKYLCLGTISTEQFQNEWATALLTAWDEFAEKNDNISSTRYLTYGGAINN